MIWGTWIGRSLVLRLNFVKQMVDLGYGNFWTGNRLLPLKSSEAIFPSEHHPKGGFKKPLFSMDKTNKSVIGFYVESFDHHVFL